MRAHLHTTTGASCRAGTDVEVRSPAMQAAPSQIGSSTPGFFNRTAARDPDPEGTMCSNWITTAAWALILGSLSCRTQPEQRAVVTKDIVGRLDSIRSYTP